MFCRIRIKKTIRSSKRIKSRKRKRKMDKSRRRNPKRKAVPKRKSIRQRRSQPNSHQLTNPKTDPIQTRAVQMKGKLWRMLAVCQSRILPLSLSRSFNVSNFQGFIGHGIIKKKNRPLLKSTPTKLRSVRKRSPSWTQGAALWVTAKMRALSRGATMTQAALIRKHLDSLQSNNQRIRQPQTPKKLPLTTSREKNLKSRSHS